MTDEYFVGPASTVGVPIVTAVSRDLTFTELGVLVRLMAAATAGEPDEGELVDRSTRAAEFEQAVLRLTELGFRWQWFDRQGRPLVLIVDIPIDEAAAAEHLRGLSEGSGDD